MSARWHVAAFPDGRYGVLRYAREGRAVDSELLTDKGRPWKADSREEADARARALNGEPALPRRLNRERFERMTTHVPLRPSTRLALMDILVGGQTWKHAADSRGVTQSGILRALRRVSALNPEDVA